MACARADDRSPEDQRFPRARRIRLGSEIRAILHEGSRARSPHLDVFTVPAPHGEPRFGAIVPRYGRGIVARNKLRRRLREIGRTEILPRLGLRGCCMDVLVRSRPQAYDARFRELRAELLRLTEGLCSDVPSSV